MDITACYSRMKLVAAAAEINA